MTKIFKLPVYKVIYLKLENQAPLSEFMAYLKYTHHFDYKFTYSGEGECFNQNFSIKENILSMPELNTLGRTKNFESIIAQAQNPFALKLLEQIKNIDLPFHSLSPEEKKMASMLKTLLCSVQYYFLHSPENFLNKSQNQLIQKAFAYEVINNQRIIMLASRKTILWPELVTHILMRDENSRFVLKKNHLLDLDHKHNSLLSTEKNQENLVFNYRLKA